MQMCNNNNNNNNNFILAKDKGPLNCTTKFIDNNYKKGFFDVTKSYLQVETIGWEYQLRSDIYSKGLNT